MPTKLLYAFIFLLLFSCREKKMIDKKNSIDTIADRSATDLKRPSQAYVLFSDSLTARMKQLRSQKNTLAMSALIYHAINDKMPLYWHGTKWEFSGTTRMPGDGSIACGYFVTTIMQDIGLKLNRSWLAQQPSSVMITATCNNIKRFARFEELEKYLAATAPASVLIIGLDFHTGFIIKDDKGKNYFFHSNYIGKAGVTKELISESRALKASRSFMIGMLSRNGEYLNR